MARRKQARTWTLLFRMEKGKTVHVYEPLRNYEIHNRLQEGWEIIE
ncbi:MAG: hypothetical protein K0Q73_7539 [Paenibacillus sp.]|jgi:hypothetical protein|nr:hypothetical protein [Paenibacillus sp.]